MTTCHPFRLRVAFLVVVQEEEELLRRLMDCYFTKIVLMCLLALGLESKPLLAEEGEYMTYREAVKLYNPFPKQLSPHVTTSTYLFSKSREKPYLEIRSQKGVIRIETDENGYFEFKPDQDLLEENPPTYLYPDGPGSFTMDIEFRKDETLHPERIKYSELTLPFSLPVRMLRNQQKRKNQPEDLPVLKELVISFERDDSCELIIKGDKDIVLKSDTNGHVNIRHNDNLVLEDATIVFPPSAASLIAVKVEDKEGNPHTIHYSRPGSE